MRTIIGRLAASVLVLAALAGCSSGDVKPMIQEKVPHDPSRFTQGLVMRDGQFVETTGLIGESKLVVWKTDGTVTKEVMLPDDVFGEGLAIGADTAYVLTWKNHKILRYSWPDLTPQESLPLDTEGWGACLDGGLLWTSDGSDTLTGRDKTTGAGVRTVKVRDSNGPVTQINELECLDGRVWANVWKTDHIISFKLADGVVSEVISAKELVDDVKSSGRLGTDDVLNGIAFSPSGDVWLTGKRWPTMYRISMPTKG